jgi:hypothetical protein
MTFPVLDRLFGVLSPLILVFPRLAEMGALAVAIDAQHISGLRAAVAGVAPRVRIFG